MKTKITTKDITDIKGFVIPKGAKIHVAKEITIKNPITGKTEIFKMVYVDNGTGMPETYPETCIKEVL